MVSLTDLVRQRYLETIRNCRPNGSRWKILVVDAHTKKHLNHVLKVYDILEEGVQQIDQLEQNRAMNPNMEALYIVLPTTNNIERICADFYTPPPPQPNKRDKNPQPPPQPQPHRYAAAHLCFIGGIPDPLFERVTSGIPEHALRAVKELYVQFWATESHVFSTRSPSAFKQLYGPPQRSAKEAVDIVDDELRYTTQSIVNALAILGEYPIIRYYRPRDKPLGVGEAYGEHITLRLARMVQDAMDAYCRDNEDFPPKPDPPRARGVLFITDRSMDLFAPFLHEFTYQAMINDLLDVEDGGQSYKHTFRNSAGVLEEKDVQLTEEDEIWKETRHMHMKDALDKLIADFQKYAGEYEQKYGGENRGINDMKDMLASLDATRKNKDSLSAHLSLAEKCMAYFEKQKLPLVADVEQACSTGLTPEGKTPRTLVEDMVPLLGDRALSSKDKVRIIALYILYRDGVPEEDRKRLFQHAHLAMHEMDMVNNLKYLGLDISKEMKSSKKAVIRQRQLEDVYDISRYQPVIKLMLDEHVIDRLDQSHFPYLRDAPPTSASARSSAASSLTSGQPASLRSSRPQWAERAKSKAVKEPKQRLIVFQLGGITYSEIRSAYSVSAASNRDVFIGSSHIITPQSFLKDLSDLDRAGGASMAASAAPEIARYDRYQSLMKNDRTPRPSAQEGFDRRFPFVSAAQGNVPPSGRPTEPPHSNSYQGDHPQQQQQQGSWRGPPEHSGHGSAPRPPQIQRQGSLSRILNPNKSMQPPKMQQGQQYDSNFNPIQTPAHQGGGLMSSSRAPSAASSVSHGYPQDPRNGLGSSNTGSAPPKEKEKKKKNFLKKAFS